MKLNLFCVTSTTNCLICQVDVLVSVTTLVTFKMSERFVIINYTFTSPVFVDGYKYGPQIIRTAPCAPEPCSL